MKNWKIAGGILFAVAAAWIAPKLTHPGVDVGKLRPAEVVQIVGTHTGVVIRTDLGDCGTGATLEDAMMHLRSASLGEPLLETADVLILTNFWEEWETIYANLRPACRVCLGKEDVDLESAALFFRVHPPEQTLAMLRGGIHHITVLTLEEGRGRYVRK